MKIIVNNQDISDVVDTFTWSGDEESVARKLVVDVGHSRWDYFFKLPNVNIAEGFTVIMYSNSGKKLFRGVIIDISKMESSFTMSFVALDLMFYVKNSEISRVFDSTAEGITKEICSMLGVKAGYLEETRIMQYLPCIPENAYKAITDAYSYASTKTGIQYHVEMDDDELNVVQKGISSGVILDDDYNLIDAEYNISISNLVNKVLVVDKTGAILDKEQDDVSMKLYGTIQKVIKEDKDKAKSMLRGAEKTISLIGIADERAVTGRSIVLIDPDTQQELNFLIVSDTHTHTVTSQIMTLGVVMI